MLVFWKVEVELIWKKFKSWSSSIEDYHFNILASARLELCGVYYWIMWRVESVTCDCQETRSYFWILNISNPHYFSMQVCLFDMPYPVSWCIWILCSREPRGFGFVQFVDPADAADAKYHMDGQVLLGRELTVVFAEENRKKPQEMRARERGR